MRVLIVPELYRPANATSNGTLNDAVAWAREWIERDDSLHVYWLLPPRESAGYDRADVLGDCERVTPIEADPPWDDGAGGHLLTENGYTIDQLRALTDAIYDRSSYVDVVVDQLRTGRFTLYKWLLEHTDHWAATVAPFDVVANVHDLQLPFKYRWCSYRNRYQMRMECASAAFADGIWFTAGIDARGMCEHASRFLHPALLEAAVSSAVVAASPIDFELFEHTYRDRPEWLHVAGSQWAKKHVDLTMGVAERLHEAFGIRTVMTSVDDVPAAYREAEWVDAHSNASREIYERALERGDLAICASEYETMARTPFEQAASGQVLLLREEPWIDDCVPADHPLVAGPEALGELAVAAVEHWPDAVAANRRLVEHVASVRSPGQCGRRTYVDLRRRVAAKTERYSLGDDDAPVERALAETAGDPVALDDLVRRTATFTGDGRPVTDRASYAFADLVYALRSLGYADTGNPGTPVFAPG